MTRSRTFALALLAAAVCAAGSIPAVADGRTSLAEGIRVQRDGAMLGVVIGGKGATDGARVASVVEDSAALRAGLREGDAIVGIDGAEIVDHLSDDEVESFMENTYVCRGEDCRFTGDQLRWHKLSCLDPGCPAYAVNFYKRPMLGVEVTHTTPELRRHLGGSEEAGVLIGKVMPGSPADLAGVRVGDLVTSINGQSVDGSDEIRRMLESSAGDSMDLQLVRDRRPLNLRVPIRAIAED